MITVSVQVHGNYIKELTRRLASGNFAVLGKMRHDMRSLGDAGYNYLKTFIPVSNLSHPHLRDSFKVSTRMIPGPGILLTIATDVSYAPFVDLGVTVPTRYPINKQAMRFEPAPGEIVFTSSARGFQTRGIRFVDKTEAWLARNVGGFVDLTLRKYLFY